MMSIDQLIFKRIIPFVFSRRLMQPVNQLALRIALSGMGINNYDGTSLDERRFLEGLARRIRKDAVIFDVGANHGQYAELARQSLPDSIIYSFEPNPAAFARLEKVAVRLKINAVAMGCASKSGTLTMYDSSADAASGLATFVPGVFEFEGIAPVEIEAKVTTVSEFARAQGIDRIDLLKIDVEGLEADVLRGTELVLDRIDAIQFEFNEMNLLSMTKMEDFERLLDGFELHRILFDGSLLPLENAPSYRKNIFCYQNIVALRRASAGR